MAEKATDKKFGPYGTKAKEFQLNKESRQKCKAFDERNNAWRRQFPLQEAKWQASVAIAKKSIAARKKKEADILIAKKAIADLKAKLQE